MKHTQKMAIHLILCPTMKDSPIIHNIRPFMYIKAAGDWNYKLLGKPYKDAIELTEFMEPGVCLA